MLEANENDHMQMLQWHF